MNKLLNLRVNEGINERVCLSINKLSTKHDSAGITTQLVGQMLRRTETSYG